MPTTWKKAAFWLSATVFLPIESVGTLPPTGSSLVRLPLYRKDKQIFRNYCVFWQKEHSNYYIEEFAHMLRNLLLHHRDKPNSTQKAAA